MNDRHYISVILPLALPKNYTYEVTNEQLQRLRIGHRVEVELRKKLFTGIVDRINVSVEDTIKPKLISEIVDNDPIVTEGQIQFWYWIAEYYCCTVGEVMDIALPSGLKLESETKIALAYELDEYEASLELTDQEYMVVEALTIRKELSFDQIKDILGKKSVYGLVRNLLDRRIIEIKEEVIQKYKTKIVRVACFTNDYKDQKDINAALSLVEKSEKQTKALLALMSLLRNQDFVPISELVELSKTDHSVFKSLEKKGIIEITSKAVSRLTRHNVEVEKDPPLTEEQTMAIDRMCTSFEQKLPVLLHGVTGSGKTRVYTELIRKNIKKDKQSLFLLPEIALTTQIVERLLVSFGNDIIVYHSKLSNDQRVEIWNAVALGKKVVIGVRSALFLPFSKLGLIIIDEEHDSSYKQSDPAPRYNARDSAVVLSKMNQANIVLGSATPSLESYLNALNKKYDLVELQNRYGESELPKISIVDLKYERKTGRLKSAISYPLKLKMEDSLSNKKQIILFQNRRGYAPIVQCEDCGWNAQCINCDVTLTLHRFTNEMRCHYCNYRIKLHHNCPECGSDQLKDIGQGTERIVEMVKNEFKEAVVDRLDIDTARTKNSMDQIIADFQNHQTDILVGTQMVTKGFDFDHIGLVAIINADALLRYVDFRAEERAFQLMVQVGGRAGRRSDRGEVIIQTYSPSLPVFQEVIANNYKSFYHRQMYEREINHFPPFIRLFSIEIKHKDRDKAQKAAEIMALHLKDKLGNRVVGPILPSVPRINNQYILHIVIKTEKDPKIVKFIKEYFLYLKAEVLNIEGIKNARINIDVDPY